jgi:uncharacterized protein CbrC (UPF0167 family)
MQPPLAAREAPTAFPHSSHVQGASPTAGSAPTAGQHDCRLGRGATYVGPVFSRQEVGDEICPWCIVDGRAAALLEAGFTDVGWGLPYDVADEVTSQIAKRTPGLVGGQQEHWLYHCADGAAFLGRAGFEELRDHPDAVDMLLRENDAFGWTSGQSRSYVEASIETATQRPTSSDAFHCGRYLAYSEMS